MLILGIMMDNSIETLRLPAVNAYINDDTNEETLCLESWKSNFNFNGDNPEYPVEMFIAIMETKYNLSNRRNIQTSKRKHHKACVRMLKHIIDNEDTPASLWKKQFLMDLGKDKLSWYNIKNDLMLHFGRSKNAQQNHCYSMHEQILLFNSLLKGREEKFSTFCIRVNIVTSILEHGNVCQTRKPSEHCSKIVCQFSENRLNFV